MAKCEFLEICPIFARFRLEGIKNYWIDMYCVGTKQDQCARKALRKQGKDVPPTLLPSGQDMNATSFQREKTNV
jgi:hypothetical protein